MLKNWYGAKKPRRRGTVARVGREDSRLPQIGERGRIFLSKELSGEFLRLFDYRCGEAGHLCRPVTGPGGCVDI